MGGGGLGRTAGQTRLGEGKRCPVQVLLERGAEPRVWGPVGMYGGALGLFQSGAECPTESTPVCGCRTVRVRNTSEPHLTMPFSRAAALNPGAARRSLPGPRRSHTSTVGMPLASPSTSTCFTVCYCVCATALRNTCRLVLWDLPDYWTTTKDVHAGYSG